MVKNGELTKYTLRGKILAAIACSYFDKRRISQNPILDFTLGKYSQAALPRIFRCVFYCFLGHYNCINPKAYFFWFLCSLIYPHPVFLLFVGVWGLFIPKRSEPPKALAERGQSRRLRGKRKIPHHRKVGYILPI